MDSYLSNQPSLPLPNRELIMTGSNIPSTSASPTATQSYHRAVQRLADQHSSRDITAAQRHSDHHGPSPRARPRTARRPYYRCRRAAPHPPAPRASARAAHIRSPTH